MKNFPGSKDYAHQIHVKRQSGTEYNRMTTRDWVYYRIIGYSIGAAVHFGNVLAMILALQGPIMKDPDVEYFYSMRFCYITIWNLVIQMLYIGMGFVCDLPVLLKVNNRNTLHWLRWYRKIFYNGILWPCGMIIVIVYWPVYVYNRNFIFPDYIDKALSQGCNFVMHLFIIFPIVWDLFFLPNRKPSSQKYIITHCLGVYIMYLFVVFTHYGYRGAWPYPALKLLYGTIYFPLVFIIITILLVIIYLLQWLLISRIWPEVLIKGT